MIRIVGDASALSTLGNLLQGDAKDRCVYYAINAVTRLTKKDLRAKPVEEMDIEETRRKVLDMLGRGPGTSDGRSYLVQRSVTTWEEKLRTPLGSRGVAMASEPKL